MEKKDQLVLFDSILKSERLSYRFYRVGVQSLNICAALAKLSHTDDLLVNVIIEGGCNFICILCPFKFEGICH